MAEDPRFNTFAARVYHAKELRAEIEPLVRDKTRKELMHMAQEWRLPFGFVASINEAVEDEGTEARGFMQELRHPLFGDFRQPGSPIRLSAGTAYPDSPPPLLGATARVLTEWLGYGAAELQCLKEQGTI